jgi:hypothetical protein
MRIGSAAIQLVETTTLSQSNRCWFGGGAKLVCGLKIASFCPLASLSVFRLSALSYTKHTTTIVSLVLLMVRLFPIDFFFFSNEFCHFLGSKNGTILENRDFFFKV